MSKRDPSHYVQESSIYLYLFDDRKGGDRFKVSEASSLKAHSKLKLLGISFLKKNLTELERVKKNLWGALMRLSSPRRGFP